MRMITLVALLRLMLGALLTLLPLSVFADVLVESAWVRHLPPTVKTTAGYMILKSQQGDVLLGVSSPVAEQVEMHRSSMAGGVMSMEEVASIRLPSKQKVELSPGGLHLMLIGLKSPLSAGLKVSLDLMFANAGTVRVEAIVK